MNKKFRILAVALSLSLCVGLLAACSSNSGGNAGNTSGDNTMSDNSGSTGDSGNMEEGAVTINTVAEVTAINEDGSLELKIYSGSGNIADFAAVDLSAYTATEETESITISDESILFTAENGSLVSSKVDAIAVGDMLVLSQDIDTDALTQVVVYAASSANTGDAADAGSTDTSAADGAETAESGDAANAEA